MRLLNNLIFLILLGFSAKSMELNNEDIMEILSRHEKEIREMKRQQQQCEARYISVLESQLKQNNLTELEERVEALEISVGNLELGLSAVGNDVEDLEDSQILQDERFLSVEADVESLENVVLDMNTRIISVEELVAEQNSEIDNLNATVASYNSSIEELQVTDVAISEMVASLEGNLEELTSSLNVTVGFLAVISGTPTCSDDDILQFDSVRSNIGNRYNSTTGIFTAEKAGLYFFATSLRANTGSNVDNLYIMLNGVEQCHLIGDGADDASTTTSCSTTLELFEGDEVFIDCFGAIYLTDGDTNVFSGFMVKPYL